MLYDVSVNLGERTYPIHIGAGVLDRIGSYCAEAGLRGRCLVVTDENVGMHYGAMVAASLEAAGCRVAVVTLPAGERSKCAETLFSLYSRCLAEGLDRKAFIVALGGGVIGDLAGFAAATFLRGIPFVQVPTSLLAMVDSSVGGKTGINLPEGKNLVGAFYQPRLVLADLQTLATLPEREYRAGLAEVAKYGVIADAKFFNELERQGPTLADVHSASPKQLARMVGRCCEIKADVVARDEREGGLRAILNFGHTVGHAVEKVAGYGRYVHGEAVAIGSVFAARASVEQAGLAANTAVRIEALLRAWALPMRAPECPWSALRRALAVDKKSEDGLPRFVLVPALGQARIGLGIPDDLMERIWTNM